MIPLVKNMKLSRLWNLPKKGGRRILNLELRKERENKGSIKANKKKKKAIKKAKKR